MRAWTADSTGSIDILALRELPDPEISSDQVLVRVKAASVNPADLKVLAGDRAARSLHAMRFPLIPGYDFSGYVERVGASVTGVREQEEVYGFLPYSAKTDRGTFAEYVAVAPGEFTRKPPGLSFADAAAAATTGMTAVRALKAIGRVRRGQRVLINGASGGVGSFAVQIAAAYGAEVWATCSAPNMEYVRRLGATRVFDYREADVSRLRARFHIVLDVPDALSYRQTERILRTGGVYITLLPSLRLVRGVISSLLTSRSCRIASVKHDAEDFAELNRLLSGRRVKAQIDTSYSMEDAPAALRRLNEGSVRGKVAVGVQPW